MIDGLIGVMLSVIIGGVAYARGSLNRSGFIVALGLGSLVNYFAGLSIFGVLMVFFITSSLLAKLHPTRPKTQRSAKQVLANGGVLLLLIGLGFIWHDPAINVLMLTSIGVAMSDTWSSEIGQKSRVLPFHVITKKPMAPGLSGGVSVLGYFAAASAAIVMGSLSFFVLETPSFPIAFLIGFFSFLGAWVDSVLGLLQVKYHTAAGLLSDVRAPGMHIAQGFSWLDNNLVNFLANLITVLLLGLLLWIF